MVLERQLAQTRLDEAVQQVRAEGWGIAHEAITTEDLRKLREEATRLVPGVEQYEGRVAADPALQFGDDPAVNYLTLRGGGKTAPWQQADVGLESPELFALGHEPTILAAVERMIDTAPIVGRPAVSVKFARGGDGFTQGFHIDPLYAVYARPSTPSVRMWVYLTDVGEENGPTEFMPHAADADDLSYFADPTADFSGYYYVEDHPELRGRQRRATAPAASILFYQARVHHRATAFTATSGCRLLAQYSYRAADRPWLAVSWDFTRRGQRIRPEFAHLAPAQRQALGFPPPSDPHWLDPIARDEAERIYAGIDLSAYTGK